MSDTAISHPSADDFIAAAEKSGIHRSADLNAPPYEGVAYRQYTIRNGRRHSSYDAFIEPVRHRRNLTVRTGVRVMRVVLEAGHATGIEVLDRGVRRQIAAAREVILSSGALASPQLLMLSGIGDAAALHRHGIAVAIDSPVWGATCRIIGSARLHGMSRRTARITTGCAGYASIWKACDMC